MLDWEDINEDETAEPVDKNDTEALAFCEHRFRDMMQESCVEWV